MYKKLLRNISFISLGTLASKFIVYLMIPLYTNILSTSEYGIIDLIFTTVSLLIPLLSCEISNALMRFLLDKEYDQEKVFNASFFVLLISIVIFIVFSSIALWFNTIRQYYLYFVFYYLVNLINSFLQSFARGVNLVKHYSVAGIIQTFFVVGLNILLLVVLKFQIIGYLLAYSIGALVSCLYLVVILKKKTDMRVKLKQINPLLVKEILLYSAPLIPNSILWWLSNSSDKYVLTLFSGASNVGIYSVAYKIPTILSVLSSVFITAWQISSVEEFGSEKTNIFFRNVAKKYLYFNVICTSAIILFLKSICSFLFQKEFFLAWEIVPILIVGYVYYTMAVFLGTIYTASKKTKMVMISTIVGSVLNIVMNFVLIPVIHMYGAAIATSISYIVIYIIRRSNSQKIIPLELGYTDFLYGIILVTQCVCIYKDCTIINVVCFVGLIGLSYKELGDIYQGLAKKIRRE